MAVDLKNLNQNQLNDLINKAQQRQDQLHKEKARKVREKIDKILKDEGYTIDEVYPTRRRGRKSRTGAKVPPKYRNPADPGKTWSGRGKRPNWFKDALKSGKKEKDLLIK